MIRTLANGTRQTEDIAAEVCSIFEVTLEQARADAEEFCQQLIRAGLLKSRDGYHINLSANIPLEMEGDKPGAYDMVFSPSRGGYRG